MSRQEQPLPSGNPLHRTSPQVLALRVAFRSLGHLAPGRAARIAERLFTSPPTRPMHEREHAFLATGTPFAVQHDAMSLAAWSWGSGPTILLMHGWGSRASRFRFFAPALAAAGYRAVALDGPGHGATGGTRATMPEFAAAIARVVAQVGPVSGYLGHSLGAGAVLLAMRRHVPAAPTVLLAAPADPEVFWKRFIHHLRVPANVARLAEANLARELGFAWSDLDARLTVAALRTAVLVLHDEGDGEVPWQEGEAIARASPAGEFVRTTGLGHRGIMRDPAVVDRAVAFFERHVPR